MKRKSFLKMAAASTAGVLLSTGCKNEQSNIAVPNVISNKKYRWKMVTTWPAGFPILGEGCTMFADWVREMSGGRLDIKVYGGGELVPPLESFEAVSSGAADIGSGAAYYWIGKAPASMFFGAIPFGMNAQQVNTWLQSGGGMQLWEEVYKPFNVIPLCAGNSGVQMGGWFNKEINSIDDFKGLKMRMPGLGGKVLQRVGGAAVLMAGGELYTGLERGVIDATEWIGPYHDYKMGFHKIAKYYYTPGWHEPGTILELFVNKSKLEKLPSDLQAIVKMASFKLNLWTLTEFEYQNAIYLQKIKESSQVSIREFPQEVLNDLKAVTEEIITEMAESDALIGRVVDHVKSFRKQMNEWSEISEKRYYTSMSD